jgi:AraC-like DNA-binding protein
MLRIISLLFPVFVSLFWVIILSSKRQTHSNPRSYLTKWMFLFFLLFTTKFFFYTPLPEIYPYFDLLHIAANCLIFPVYHNYFRLLTVDEKFSWKVNGRFFILPIILVLIYGIGVLLTPSFEYRTSLFQNQAFPNSPQVLFLNIMRQIFNYYIQFQVIYYLIKNSILLTKYGSRAEQFYSNIQDGKYNNAKMLNYILVINAVITLILYVIYNKYTEVAICLFPVLYGITVYMTGYMGYKQKPVNPTFDLEIDEEPEMNEIQPLFNAQEKILDKLLKEFEEKKIYLNSELNILDVVSAIGTNRTYISVIINQQFNQNFCSFVNGYRIEELHRVYAENRDFSNETLADCCGFGSVNSLKRAVFAKTGLSIVEWKKQVEFVHKAV